MEQLFSGLTGYIALVAFLLINGLVFFVFPDTSLLDFGYASLDNYFRLAPWILLFLVPTVTMRSMADEYRTGTFEILKTRPVTASQIVWGKLSGAFLVVLLALVPTVIYAVSLQQLSAIGGVDVGSTTGSYIGLLLLGAAFTSIGICASSFTPNTMVAFLAGALTCLVFFTGFDAISRLPVFASGAGYYIQLLGIDVHYRSISKGVVDGRDIIYFITLILLFVIITIRNISRY